MPIELKRAYGCIFCKTGREVEAAKQIQLVCPDIYATAAFQEKHKSEGGKKTKVKAVMLPGYVFFDAPDDFRIDRLFQVADVLRILKGMDQEWQLSGSDHEFTRWLFHYDGCIGFSAAYQEGDRIRILSGPLKDMEGMISRIDRRGRSGQVILKFDQREIRLWLGFDLIGNAMNTGMFPGKDFGKDPEKVEDNRG